MYIWFVYVTIVKHKDLKVLLASDPHKQLQEVQGKETFRSIKT